MSFQKKLESIFEIKINEERICTTFKGIEEKLSRIQQRMQDLESHQQKKGIFNCDEDKLKIILHQFIYNAIQPLRQRSLEHDTLLHNLQYNHENLCCNVGEDIKSLEKHIQNAQQQISRKLVEEELRTRSQLQGHQSAIHEQQALLKALAKQQEDRQCEYQQQINKLWEILKKGKREAEALPTQQRSVHRSGYLRRGDGKQSFSIFNEASNLKRNSTVKKMDGKQQSFFQVVQCKQKTVEFASLLAKIQTLEKRLNELTTSPFQEKTLTSKYRIDNQSDNEDLPDKQVKNLRGLEGKKTYKVHKVSRFRNSINLQDYSQNSISQAREDRDMGTVNEQIRKINARLNDFKYKYTLLQENHQIILNKIAKLTSMEATIQLKIDEAERLRVDLTTINQINLRFRKIQASFEEHQRKYVSLDSYQKEIAKVKENIKQIQSFGQVYARSEDIKSAFEFIEHKIKEIVIVLTDKFENDKEGAINKIQQIRCLTCDKEVEGNSLSRGNSSLLSRNAKLRNQKNVWKRLKTQQ